MDIGEIIAIIAILLIIGGAVAYIVKAKKSGKKCIGCPSGGCCPSAKGGCNSDSCGNCSGCSGCGANGKHTDEHSSSKKK